MKNGYNAGCLIFFIFLVTFLNACSTRKMNTNTSESKAAIIAEGASIQLISKQFNFTEGPAADKAGNVFFTDQPNDKIWKYGTDGQLSVFLDKTGRANGMYFDAKGNLITCSDEQNQLWSIDPAGKATVLVNDFKGRRFNGPNDVWVHPKGGMYFTDPLYPRPWWKTKPDIEGERVYYLAKDSKEPILVASTLVKPNGIVGTPDGKYLYVGDIGGNKTFKYAIGADGTLGEPILFTAQGSDGMTIDNKGNIYLTGKGVTVYNSDGQKIEHIAVDAKWTANVCFGGKKRDTLFITASEGVYILKMNVKGV
ncbi:MAG: SMP-30/gluconolactonase/LRE family protein [Segetibacter sp.]|nr:SMP-30/gluconolactonase/LRE family protein [Segetibacter sp.]